MNFNLNSIIYPFFKIRFIEMLFLLLLLLNMLMVVFILSLIMALVFPIKREYTNTKLLEGFIPPEEFLEKHD